MSVSEAYRLFRQLQGKTADAHEIRNEIDDEEWGIDSALDEIQGFLDVPHVEAVLEDAIAEVNASLKLAIVLARKHNFQGLSERIESTLPFSVEVSDEPRD